MRNDISTAFKWNQTDSQVLGGLINLEETPEAVLYLAKHASELSDYAYWFGLSTCWVSYSGHSDLNLWKQLFNASRPNKEISLMKPSEIKVLAALPNKVTVYRVHHFDETDWIAYTLSKEVAINIMNTSDRVRITVGRVKKNNITALFTRREEDEVIILDKNLVKNIKTVYEKASDKNAD